MVAFLKSLSCFTCSGKKQYCSQYSLVQKMLTFTFNTAWYSQATTLKWVRVAYTSPHHVLSNPCYVVTGVKKMCWPFLGVGCET